MIRWSAAAHQVARRLILAASLVAVLSCAPTLPAAYQDNFRAARNAYAEGQYARAAQLWKKAEQAAPNKHHRDEARYRRASSLNRAGRPSAALELYTKLASTQGERQARAAFDLAYLTIEQGQTERGYELLARAMLSHPNSGNADRALLELLERKERQQGIAGALDLTTQLQTQLANTELMQALGWRRAQLLERQGDAGAALQAYQQLTKRFPYPTGVYWDESMLRIAELQIELGHADQALGTLRAMLKERESSTISGSYERRFSAAHYRIAEIERDHRNDWKAARDEFDEVAAAYRTSLLRDDALWQSALLSKQHGDPEAACVAARRLSVHTPDSRYNRCTHLVCDQISPGPRRCPAYAVQQAQRVPPPN